MEVKNRIAMAPMTTMTAGLGGTVTQEGIDYYTERARGGTGMIVMDTTFTMEKMTYGGNYYRIDNPEGWIALSDLVDSVHRYDARICIPLTPGPGRNGGAVSPDSASEVEAFGGDGRICHAMTIEEIKEVIESFRQCAATAKMIGFDAIQIHAHGGYLLDQFMSPVWNKRTDQYGGSFENRMRFAVELIDAVRSAVGEGYPIIYRLSINHEVPEGGFRSLADSIDIIKYLEKAGVNALDVDLGCYETMDYIFPTTYMGDAVMLRDAAEAKKAVSIPIINCGNYTPDTALEAIESSMIDIVSLGRGLVADPFFTNKLRLGKPEDVRPCIRCNEYCINRIYSPVKSLSCAVNPQVGHEKRYELVVAKEKKRVAVIGAGPAGLEAARTAAECGHEVTIYEKNDYIGGQAAGAGTQPFKTQIKNLINWFDAQLKKARVTIKYNQEVRHDFPELADYDEIIVAVGANTFTPPILGLNNANVVDVLEAHFNHDLIKGDTIVVCGGGLSGCDMALELAMAGKHVSIIEMLDTLAPNLVPINMITLQKMLKEHHVEVYTKHVVKSISDTGVIVETPNKDTIELKANTVIAAFGTKPNTSEAKAIRTDYMLNSRIIGDCQQVGNIGSAVRSGFYAGSSVM